MQLLGYQTYATLHEEHLRVRSNCLRIPSRTLSVRVIADSSHVRGSCYVRHGQPNGQRPLVMMAASQCVVCTAATSYIERRAFLGFLRIEPSQFAQFPSQKRHNYWITSVFSVQLVQSDKLPSWSSLPHPPTESPSEAHLDTRGEATLCRMGAQPVARPSREPATATTVAPKRRRHT